MSRLHHGILLQTVVALFACSIGCKEATAGAPPNCTDRPSISGLAQERQKLVIDEGTWVSDTQVSYSYQWSRCVAAVTCTDISGATAKKYVATADDVGRQLRARVYARNAEGTSARFTDLTATVTWAPPLNTQAPALTGSGRESEPLEASLGAWTGNVLSLQLVWHRCDASGCAPMDLSTSAYTPVFADVGSRLSVEVIATGLGGSTTAVSNEVQIVAMPPALVVAPEVQGEAREGVPLIASPGSWSWNVDHFEYQWQTCDSSGETCAAVSGATGEQWTPDFSAVGARIRVQVWAVGAGGITGAVSAPSAPVLHAPPTVESAPVISGPVVEGEPLAATVGTWSGVVDGFAYQWSACDPSGADCTALAGQTDSTLVVDGAWLGQTLRVTVTATGPGGANQSVSNATARVVLAPAKNTAPPTISGLARDGELLTASPGTWAGKVSAYAYKWARCDATTQACQQVGSASDTYRLGAADVGSTVQVEVTASNVSASATATSEPTANVSGLPPAQQREPSIAGVLAVGQVLTGGRGAWSGTTPLSWRYQWLRCDALGSSCAPISGATSSRYLITGEDLGHSLRFEVAVSNPVGSLTASSPTSGEVLAGGYAQVIAADAPLGYWRFGETGGTVANDSSGNGATGTFFGGAAPGAAGALPDGNRAASFDGVNGRVDFGDRFDFEGNSAFTFEAWIRPSVVDSWHRRIIEKEEKSAAGYWEGYRLAINSSMGIYCERWQAGSNAGLTSVPMTQLTQTSWQHVACTYDGATMRMYVNGVLAASKASPNLVAATTAPFTIGSFSGGGSSSWFAGGIDDVAVYGTALSDAQLRAHVNAAQAQALVAFAPPAVEGQGVPGRVLTGSTGTWRGGLPVQFSWQWLRCDQRGDRCADIAGATAARYQVTDADAGSRVRLRVTASNSQGPTVATSDATPIVPNVTPVFVCVEAESAARSGTATAYVGPAETRGGTVVLGAQGTGELSFPFTLPDSQPVTVWARVRSQTRTNNALRVTLAEQGFSSSDVWDIPISPVLRWQKVTLRGASGTEVAPAEQEWPGILGAGDHELRLQGEDAGVEIDAVCVSTADVEPDERLPEPPQRAIARSVKDFGAVGDGVADDTTALQAAFDSLQPGEALAIPAGRYRFTSTLTLNRHEVSIVGEGASSILFADFPASATGNAINVAGGYEGAEFPLLADAVPTDRELLVGATAPFQVGDVVLVSSDEWGPTAPNLTTLFYRNRAHLLRITKVTPETAGLRLTVDRPLQSEFSTAHNARAQKFNGLRQVVLSNFAVEGTAQPVATDNADTNLILVNRCDRCFFADLELRHARKSAIEIARALDSSAIRMHVSDATDTGGGGHGYGVAVSRSQGVIVRDSVFDGVLRHGNTISWGARETFVYRNVFDRSATQTDKLASVDLHGQDDYGNLVEDNLITGGTEAIIVGGGGTSHGNDGSWNVIRRNRVENAKDAISVYKSTFNTVIDQNELVGSTGYAVRIETGSHDALVWSNRVDGYVGAGARISTADRAEVRDNDLVPGSGPAVQIVDSSGYLVSGNSLGGGGISAPGTGVIEINF